MNKMLIKQAVLLGCVGLGLAGCSRGPLTSTATSTSGGTTVATSVGKVADGYVSGAKVTLDTNDNGACESTEPSTTTDVYGNYNFPASDGSHMVCSVGGTDIATGQAETGTLYAPPGATTVNPLTALVVAQLKAAGTPVTAANATAAATTLATKLGLPAGTDLLNDDPAKEVVVNGVATPSNPALESTTAAVATLLAQVTSAVSSVASGNGGTTSSSTSSTLYGDALAGLASALSSSSGPVSASTLGSLAQSVVQSTVTTAQGDSSITGLTGLNAAGIAAVAGPSIATSTDAVGSASASSLLTAGSGNPATVADTSTTLNNLLTSVASTLTTSTVTAASVIGSNSTHITSVTANGTAVSGTVTLTANPITTLSMTGNTPLTDITVGFASATGKATTGTASTATTTSMPDSNTEVDSSVTIAIAPTTASSQSLTLSLDHALLYQVSGVVCGDVPSTAILTVSGKTSGGTAVSATLSGTTAQGIVTFSCGTGTVKLNIQTLITDLGSSMSQQLPALMGIANGTGTNKSYLVTTIVPGLTLSDNQSTPAIGDSFGVGVNF